MYHFPSVWSFVADPEVRLLGTIDAESRLAQVPSDYTLKGMFFGSVVESLGQEAWQYLKLELSAPPRGGRYVPFVDYPQVDYCRIALAAAARLYPEQPMPEAARRLGRHDFSVFTQSRVGKVLLHLAGDLSAVLQSLPSTYSKVSRGGRITSSPLSDGGVRLEYVDYHGWVDCYTLGTIEGIVQHFGHRPSIRVSLASETEATYDVHWS